MKKIYIVGPIGSGKTTFSKQLSKKYSIKNYELDKIVWDDDNGNIKRTEEEITKLFNDVLKNKSWIIEDVGRDIFIKGKEQADIIYYIRVSRLKAYFRVVKRWIKQRFKMESYNSPPTIKELLYFISTTNSYYKKEKEKINKVKRFESKLIFINSKKIKEILNDNNHICGLVDE